MYNVGQLRAKNTRIISLTSNGICDIMIKPNGVMLTRLISQAHGLRCLLDEQRSLAFVLHEFVGTKENNE